ncbi:hypothetical protein RAY_283 [Erwinia phage vB_EamM_RAY]|uniref:Uncharacterized protein n=5 Tax=Agricanvirus TaxID=1984776 RepID=A0A173GEP7_9CAUD|nr:hypothetical protein FDH98_gp235 [Erwinia phage vB_EamM_RAY]YP_009606071.1 hypothetical protein FDH99_gp238 [Erwinia phage vB_EamM_Simmy50]YP_009606392.1 hypothetical protein FDI00_gp286 [Erwinia phage vB_EamM_Special G]AUG86072.1 hypothetical protein BOSOLAPHORUS_286 [Erwinia phage vB_EamM_Bosolaphorus]AUG86713.1 hypothetical protein MADMEL_286 [Erwinia phage vB_EamM_MadMel]ANH51746.1 hypothetical protein SIMMY50_288 [Erwinia phage vB_EamM_Simmy50]ANH52063.1 hypothetical protein RAY_283 [
MLELLMYAGKKTVKMSYADFVTWLNTNTTKYSAVSAASNTGTPSSTTFTNGYARISMTADGGNMWGTPYLNSCTHDSTWARIARHACPAQTMFDYMLANKQFCLMKLGPYVTKSAYSGLNRNGYTSLSYGSFNGRTVLDFIYYDNTQGVVMRWTPLNGGTPVPFNGVLI